MSNNSDNYQTGDDFTQIYEGELGQNDNDSDVADSPMSLLHNKCLYIEPEEFHSIKNVTHGSSYFHLNCRGLSSNWEKFRNLIDDINDDTFTFDFIGISEIFYCEKTKD